MRYIADFHIHSKYSRAVSPQLVIEKLHEWAGYKGIDVMGTGDFTHPLWFREIEEKLEPAEEGLYQLKSQFRPTSSDNRRVLPPVRYILTSEVATIFRSHGKVRRIHNILIAPSLVAVRQINKQLANIGNLQADGRPILGLSSKDLLRIVLDADPEAMLIPAHAWTPWFGLLGSKSGFDSLEECFEELTPEIFAIETGLSSDPEMNWRLSKLDRISLISCSDAHSLPNLGREATVFELPELSYRALKAALQTKDPTRLLGTIEFYPEEGMYHLDGHAEHKVALTPRETKQAKYRCPVCQGPVTVGVQHRVDDLADRQLGVGPLQMPASWHIVPLREIIAAAFGAGKTSKKVEAEYWKLIYGLGNEFHLLLDVPLQTIATIAQTRVTEGIRRVRSGELSITPGYDGVYGIVKVFSESERTVTTQGKLF